MTNIKAMKLALDALEDVADYDKCLEAIASLRQAISEAEQTENPWIETNKALAKEIIELTKKYEQAEKEPVAWMNTNGAVNNRLKNPLPPQREWVSLTDDDWNRIMAIYSQASISVIARAIEAKLKEKNT